MEPSELLSLQGQMDYIARELGKQLAVADNKLYNAHTLSLIGMKRVVDDGVIRLSLLVQQDPSITSQPAFDGSKQVLETLASMGRPLHDPLLPMEQYLKYRESVEDFINWFTNATD